MEKLQQFVTSIYTQLNAKPDEFTICKSQLKHYLSQLLQQYKEEIHEQENQYLSQQSEENDSYFSLENDKGITTEFNEMKYCRKLEAFLQKLKKQNLIFNISGSPKVGRLSKDRLIEILHHEVNDLIQMSQLIHQYSGIHEVLKKVEQLIQYYKQVKVHEERMIVKCPLTVPHTISKEVAMNLIKQEQLGKFHCIRISFDQVFYYQRYLLSYYLRNSLFEINLPPGFVMRLTNQPKRYQYFFVTTKKQQQELKITKNQFAKHYLSLFCSDHLEHLVPQYYGDLEVFYGNALPQQVTKYEQFKNPLFHLKRDICETTYDQDEFEAIRPNDVFQVFLNFLSFLSQTSLHDFNVYGKDQLRIKSLHVSQDMLQMTIKRIQKMENTFIYIQEVLFPQHFTVKLIQITQLINPIFVQFMRLETSKFTFMEYQEFISKLNLEEVMQKLVDSHLLIKYNTQFVKEQQNNEKTVPEEILHFLQKLHFQYDISLTNRIKLLDYLSQQSFFQVETQFTKYQSEIYDKLVEGFNESWFDCELWKQAFKANYSSALTHPQFNNTFFVELLAIHFLQNKYSQLNINSFESIALVDESDQNCKKMILYLMNKKLNLYLGNHSAVAESALKFKKFNLLLALLRNEQGKNIRPEFYTYLHQDCETNYHNQIFEEIGKMHPHLLGRLKWDYFWDCQSRAKGEKELLIFNKGIIKLTDEQFQQIFTFEKQELPSYLQATLNSVINHNTNKSFSLIKIGDQELLFMQPNYPLQKYMALQLFKLLALDQFISKVELAIHKQIYSIFEVINTHTEGQRTRFTISQYMQHHDFNEQNLKNKIGSFNLAHKILTSILLFSSNITPDQELLVPCGQYFAPVTTNFYLDPKFDNFINPSGFEREGERVSLSCKNIYFLMEFMNEKIDLQYLKKFQNLTLTLQQWLKQLTQLQIEKAQGLLILPLNKDNMTALIQRSAIIMEAKGNITYLDLLKQCDHNFGDLYQDLINNHELNLIQKYHMLSQPTRNYFIQSDVITFRESFVCGFRKYPSGFTLKKAIGPSKGLKMILKYTRLLSQSEDFNKRLHIVNKCSHIQLLLNSMDWQSLKEGQITQAIESLIKYSQDYNKPFDYLAFNLLSFRQFPQLFQQFELIRIKTLNLTYVDSITDSFISEIALKCSELHALNISGCQGLVNLGGQKRLQFLRLKTLIAQDNPNLKLIDMTGQYLHNLNINNCPLLSQVYCLKKLSKIQVKGCRQLQQEIVEMWLLQGIEILFDENTSGGYFSQMKSIIKMDEYFTYNRAYVEIIFSLLGDIYEKFLATEQYLKSPYPSYLVKSGFVNDESQNQFLTFLQKQLDEKGKRIYIIGILQCLLRNENINTLDLGSLIKQKTDEKRKYLEQFLTDFASLIESSIGQVTSESYQITKTFLKRIEWITIPSTVESVLEKICYLMSHLVYFRQQINVSFANLKTIRSGAIQFFFQNIRNLEKYPHICKLDFSCNSLNSENLISIFTACSLSSVQNLNLSNTGIDDSLFTQICKLFWSCENLRSIDLSQNSITSEGLNQLMEQGLEMKIVQTPLSNFNLSKNNIGQANFELLAKIEALQWQNKESQMLYLKSLILNNCFHVDQDITQFTKYIIQSYNLQILDLRKNQFNETAIEALSKAIGLNKSLVTLLYQNEVKNSKPLLFHEIVKNPTLQHLDLSIHQYDDSIAVIFEKFQTLTLCLPTVTEEDLGSITNMYQESEKLFHLEFTTLDNEVKERTFYKLGLSKINVLNEQKEEKEIKQSEKFSKQDTLRIDISDYSYTGLSIDGGGIRGLMPATILNYLCNEMKKEPYQLFDSVGGTSIGGMLALTIVGTKDGHTPLADKDTLQKLFTEEGKIIFDDSRRGVWNIMSKSKYDGKGIESVLQRYCGTVKLSETLPHTNVIVTAVKLQKEKGETVAKVFSSRKAKVDLTENFLMKDCGRATSAAPTYFPAAQIKSLAGKEYQFIDGGIGVNNPSNFVLEDLRKCMLNRDQDNFFLLSLSTGISKQKQPLQVDEGLLSVGKIIDAFGESNQEFVDLELRRHEGKYLRITPEYDLPDNLAQMDCTDPRAFEKYQEAAIYAAEQNLHKEMFGRFQDKSFIRWLEENTARRLENK